MAIACRAGGPSSHGARIAAGAEPGAAGEPAVALSSSPMDAITEPVEVVPMAGQTPAVFAVRGARSRAPLVFLHGSCCHAQGYAQAFQFAAAERGQLIAPQGDVACAGGAFSTWSRRIDDLDRRIESSFRELGISPLGEVTVIGYSLGGTRALELVRHRPDRYTRLVTIAAPGTPSPVGLTKLRSAVTMAGERDRQDQMRAGARALNRAGIPTKFSIIPGAAHGQMGNDPERTMAEALDWVLKHERTAAGPDP